MVVVVVVFRSNSKEKYDHVKKYLCVAFPVPSQCVVGSHTELASGAHERGTKITLQMACKTGGEIWNVVG